MSSNFKSVPVVHPDAARAGSLYRVAIVGAGTLKGKEVAEVLADRNFPSVDVKLLDDNESLGQLESVGDEVSFIQNVRAEQFENVDFTFFASDPECTRQTWKTAQKAGSAIVDLSFALEGEPDAVVRSPWIQRLLGQTFVPELQPGPAVVAHPAAVVLALLLLRVQKAAAVKRVVATVFEPASEHGQKGMDELHEQTVNLLSFQPLPKKVFDAQVAFNMVARYGEASVTPLATVERRVLKHYQQIAGADAPPLSLLLLQAPIFHGYGISLHVEMDKAVEIENVSKALAGEHVTVTASADESPSNVNAAGQGDVLVSVLPDAGMANGLWLWAAADNLRIAAATAVECAENMAATRPTGKIQ
ncbi:MAG TPA: Asd/ArgC dimerization domain-containing protein [Terriglobales bacterium]|jgi:aspartate-semialdehyde dehydrogenase|nr:Asd/ArgC dimerization domain-containing protein [Terriglobales bacterium]